MLAAKRLSTVAAVTLGCFGVAQAADLPARVAPAPYIAPLPIFTWTGAYFGINAGAAFDNSTRFNLTGVTAGDNGVGSTRPGTFKNNDDGFTAGGQIGYNYQFGAGGLGGFGGGGVVIGLEADAAYIDSAKTGTYGGLSTGGLPSVNNFRSGIDYLGTVRGRLGYAFNQFLIYGTGGFAYGETFEKASLYTAGNAAQLRYFGSRSDMQTGYTYGGGVEYALPTSSFLNFFKSSAVTIKGEYLRYDLGSSSFLAANQLNATTGSAYSVRTKTEGNIVRVGLNYKF